MTRDNFDLPLHYMLAADGRTPIPTDDVLEWGLWFESTKGTGARVLAQTDIPGGRVSTVFLGLDYSFGDGPLVLWESMVFVNDVSVDMDRYPTHEEARAGHDALVAEYTSGSCPECEGRGEVLDAPSNVLDGRAYWTPCPVCDGTGRGGAK